MGGPQTEEDIRGSGSGMYLLDSSCSDRMERGTPQRKTVYRISLTLVKRESLDDDGGADGGGGGGAGGSRVENPKAGAFRRESSVEIQRGGLLEELKEVEDESDDFSSSRGYMRNFRTFSTGQLELGRLKICSRKQQEVCAGHQEKKKKRLLKAKSVEEKSSDKMSSSNGTSCPETRPPGLLRRSFSFRHWSGGELLRLRALSRDKHHSSSGCIGPDARGDGEEDVQATPPTPLPPSRLSDPTRQKSRTLEVGAVLNKTDSMSELSRWERTRGSKNRTLDNSDLLRLDGAGGGSGGSLQRGAGGRSSERRLVRFFSGIFSRRDGASTSTPTGSPGSDRSLRRIRRTPVSQSSTESMNGGNGCCRTSGPGLGEDGAGRG